MLKASRLKYIRTNSSDILHPTGNLMIFLIGPFDHQTYGALIRTCFYLGVDHIIADEGTRCALTPAVSKASAGALELAPLHCTPNPVAFLEGINSQQLFLAILNSLHIPKIASLEDGRYTPSSNHSYFKLHLQRQLAYL